MATAPTAALDPSGRIGFSRYSAGLPVHIVLLRLQQPGWLPASAALRSARFASQCAGHHDVITQIETFPLAFWLPACMSRSDAVRTPFRRGPCRRSTIQTSFRQVHRLSRNNRQQVSCMFRQSYFQAICRPSHGCLQLRRRACSAWRGKFAQSSAISLLFAPAENTHRPP